MWQVFPNHFTVFNLLLAGWLHWLIGVAASLNRRRPESKQHTGQGYYQYQSSYDRSVSHVLAGLIYLTTIIQ